MTKEEVQEREETENKVELLKDNKDDEKYYNHIIDFVVKLFNSEIDESEQIQACVYEKLYELNKKGYVRRNYYSRGSSFLRDPRKNYYL